MITSAPHFEGGGPELREKSRGASRCDAGSGLSDRKRTGCDVARLQPGKDPFRPGRRCYCWTTPEVDVAVGEQSDLHPSRAEKLHVQVK